MIITYCLIAMFCTGLLLGACYGPGAPRKVAVSPTIDAAALVLMGAIWPYTACLVFKLWKEGKL